LHLQGWVPDPKFSVDTPSRTEGRSARSLKIDSSTDGIVAIFSPCILTELLDAFAQATTGAYQLIPWSARAGITFWSFGLGLALEVDTLLVFIELSV